jgi:dienelactone hydrolase
MNADVIGMDFINVQLYVKLFLIQQRSLTKATSIADQYAANGYFVVIPDLFNGNTVPLNPPADFELMKWIETKMPRVPTVDPIIEAVIKELRGAYGVKRLGGVGYCFGGKYVCRFLKEGSLDAGFTAHPSFVDPEEVEEIAGPLSIAAAGTPTPCRTTLSAQVFSRTYEYPQTLGKHILTCCVSCIETDQIFPAPKRHETEAILNKKDVPWQINLYSDVVHGFAVRCDLSKKREKFAKEQAFLQAVNWFDEHIKSA